MRGQMKFVDGKTGSWGFIIPEDGGADVHFANKDVVGASLTRSDAGSELEFDVEEDASGRRHARNVRLVAVETGVTAPGGPSPTPAPIPTPRSAVSGAIPGDELSQWAFMVFADFTARDGRTVKSVLPGLAKMALEERWYFGKEQDPHNPFPILVISDSNMIRLAVAADHSRETPYTTPRPWWRERERPLTCYCWIRGQEVTTNRVFSGGAYRPPSFEELAGQQGVTPIDDFKTLLGDALPEDESPEEFSASLREWRREGSRASQAHAPLRRETEGLLGESVKTCAASVWKRGTPEIVCSIVRKPAQPDHFQSLTPKSGRSPIGRLSLTNTNIQNISPSVFNVPRYSPPNPRSRSSILRVGQGPQPDNAGDTRAHSKSNCSQPPYPPEPHTPHLCDGQDHGQGRLLQGQPEKEQPENRHPG
jgi:cold shock CspA family protein